MGAIHGKHHLSRTEIRALALKTHFTEKQIKKWHSIFLKDCPSGQLNRRAFLDMYTHFFPDGKAKDFYAHLFRTFDQDNSGQIDFSEFLSAISITQSGGPEEKLGLAFQLYDIDGNGHIEESEMNEIIKAIYLMVGETDPSPENSSEVRTHAIFKKMDLNSDHVLSKEEFIRGCINDEHLYNLLASAGS
ncbi:Neuronal calcium sensor 2 [Echinococcus granulosus]|uniref:Neuronal calcium sensor n=3 Tax=Taeniidae TaxID=6208 RepID=A0A068WBT5_ECHGR|nr:Neuronal calcium sensor 2 [Echinococcus granulosus]CDS17557.1 neuronal calcium sensor [Echinococcus granulosus]CDS42599.1 neuronal calcium sensor [Echinococcus multilocularis]